jgi:hypothetical protein
VRKDYVDLSVLRHPLMLSGEGLSEDDGRASSPAAALELGASGEDRH